MATVKNVIDDIIFEDKNVNLKLFYNIDVFIQEFRDKTKEETLVPETEEVPAETEEVPTETTTQENTNEKGDLLTEAIFKQKAMGGISIPKEDVMNIQTIQDLIDYLSDKDHMESNQGTIQKVLNKDSKKVKGKILSPEIQEVVLTLAGMGGEEGLGDIIDKGDKVVVELQYGNTKTDSIGFKINKSAGTDVFSIMIMKDGEILPGAFNPTLVNKQILFYRNSIV